MEDADYLIQSLKGVFGNTNSKSHSIRAIMMLRQTKGASEYAVKFQEYAAFTEWNDAALQDAFRRGLKPEVKEDLMRLERHANLTNIQDLIATAVKIDDELYERTLERRYDQRTVGPYVANTKAVRQDHRRAQW